MSPAEFITRWSKSGGAEIANSHSFLKELCTLLDVPQPDPTQAEEDRNTYTFEKAVKISNGDGTFSDGRLDLYRQGCFVLESKQCTEQREALADEQLATVTRGKKVRKGHAERGTPQWTLVMQRARAQAERYAKNIPGEWPPFLLIVDVGHCIQLFADFSQSGKNYQPFPDPQSFQIWLTDLARPEIRERLRAIWLDPPSLDPSRIAAKVTRQLAEKLARLAKSLEGKYEPKVVADFLMRCLFTMFVEDMEIGGFQSGDFKQLLQECRSHIEHFVPMVEGLWSDMNTGHRLSGWIKRKILQFNGGLFESVTALPVTADQLELLIEAAEADWREVEPAIFGTLLERALDPVERHKLGAHYTPRAYVERLVMPTIIEPLREQWANAYATAVSLSEAGKKQEAIETVRNFHQQLCETTVLDPACGSGNFLYVSLELMKRLEGEVLNALKDLGDKQQVLITIDPHQFLGIELNPRAASITDLVLWIGYLQWHSRTRGKEPIKEPIIRKFRNIENRDAVLAWDAIEPAVDAQGQPVTRWDGRTTKPHPVTREQVPDETARVQELRYINPRKAAWPKADYIVGNPPFLGGWKIRQEFGDGYCEALWKVYDTVPNKADYVMYWWDRAAAELLSMRTSRFGFITTNSLRQSFNRRIVANHLENGCKIVFAVPDHPWVDSADGADVRISMTVTGSIGDNSSPRLLTLVSSRSGTNATTGNIFSQREGIIRPDLTIGADLDSCSTLVGNKGISFAGVKLHGAGFIVSQSEALALGNDAHVIKDYRNGKDIAQRPRNVKVIDFFGFQPDEVRTRFPRVFQHVLNRVKPERDQNRDRTIRENWWLHGRPRAEMRQAQKGLSRFIATIETGKHRYFTFLPDTVLPDNMLVTFALDDAFWLGVLSSQIHVRWALSAGGRLGVGNDPRYQNVRCFDPFPFPDPDEPTKQRIRDLGEQLDAHRKRQQALHPELTMTGMYNVLEKLRSGEPLNKKEQVIHEQGLVSVLKQIHDDLDAAVFAAYGWPVTLTDEEILQRLVDLNHERAAEEAQGKIRWLRPDFQNPQGTGPKPIQGELIPAEPETDETDTPAAPPKIEKAPWPKSLPERIKAVRDKLSQLPGPSTAADLAKLFKGAQAKIVGELLETLVTVGQATRTASGKYRG